MKVTELKNVLKPILFFIGIIAFSYVLVLGVGYYTFAITKKVLKDGFVYIPTGSSQSDQARILIENGYLRDTTEFINIAGKMKYNKIYSGKFKLEEGMTYRELFSVIGVNKQTPTRLVFNYIDDVNELASKLSTQIELDSVAIVNMLSNDTLLSKFDLSPNNAFYIFIPNTYEVYWNMSEEKLLGMMKREYDKFWTKRQEKLAKVGLSQFEVATLASIVEKECRFKEEMPIVAGVYLNRLKKGMYLQSDPTVKFAVGDKGLRRILNKHLNFESPYNTYLNPGLPPTPICLPSIVGIDAVLNYTKSDYLYFCASEKMDMTHRFATSYNEHLKNAKLYRKALDKAGILK